MSDSDLSSSTVLLSLLCTLTDCSLLTKGKFLSAISLALTKCTLTRGSPAALLHLLLLVVTSLKLTSRVSRSATNLVMEY